MARQFPKALELQPDMGDANKTEFGKLTYICFQHTDRRDCSTAPFLKKHHELCPISSIFQTAIPCNSGSFPFGLHSLHMEVCLPSYVGLVQLNISRAYQVVCP